GPGPAALRPIATTRPHRDREGRGACAGMRRPGRARPANMPPTQPSERALHFLDAVALDDVADAHVLVVLEGHAAFLTGDNLLHVVLEALELAELALVDDDVVADEAHVGPALDDTIRDAAARDLADLRDVEDLEDLRIAQHVLAQRGRQHARHRLLHVIHEVVDDVVVAD